MISFIKQNLTGVFTGPQPDGNAFMMTQTGTLNLSIDPQ